MKRILRSTHKFLVLLLIAGATSSWAGTTTTTMFASPSPSATGQTVTLSAQVYGALLSGTVTFCANATAQSIPPCYGGTTLGTATVSASGYATLNTVFATTGTRNLTAVYTGNANNSPSFSTAWSQKVIAATTTALTTTPNPSVAGQAVTLTATVAGANPTGNVTFKDGASVLGITALVAGKATRSYVFTTAGAHSLTAVYGGDLNNGTSTSVVRSQTVNVAPTTTVLTTGVNPSATGQAVTLTATITGTAPTGTVTFKDGAATLGTATVSAGKATLSYTFTTAGAHSLTAVYGGNANNATSTSAAVSQTVKTATTTALATSLNPSTAGQAVALTATVTGASPTGSVTFKDGATILGTGTVSAGIATLNHTFTTAGAHSLTAVYGGNASNAASTSAVRSQTVNAAPTSTVLTTGVNPSATGQAVALTATITGMAPTGTVTFKDGATTLGTATVSAGKATLSYTFTTAGAHSLTAVYAGNTNNAASTSAAVSQTVKTATTTALATSLNPSTAGQAVALTATVTGASPTGSVTFKDGATILGTGTVSAGIATLNHTFTTAGAHSLTVVYGGDANNAVSTSAAVSQTVNTASTTTALTTGTNPSAAAQAVTLTATITGTVPTGTVTFKDGATTLGTGTVSAGIATLNYTFNTVGAHNLTAVYGGDTNNVTSTSAAVSQTVNVAVTTTVLTSGANPSAAGQGVVLTATLTGLNPTGVITFMDGATTLGTGTVSAGKATLNYTFTTAGSHNLTAVYGGDANNGTSTSAALGQTVTINTSTTTLATSLNPSAAGQTVTLTATVTGANPTGSVTFKDGTTTLGSGTISAGVATLDYVFTIAGTHNLTAVYEGDTSNAVSTSAAVSQTVNTASTTTALTTGTNPSAAAQAVTLTATITGAVPTGAVTFKDGATTLGTGTVSAGIATLNYTFNTVGAHNLTAVYGGDANNVTSTSAAVSQTVNVAVTTTVLTSGTNPSAVGQGVVLTATLTGLNPTGVVTFMDGATTLGTGTVSAGKATLNYTFITAGAHNLTAVYGGDANNGTSTSAAVDQTVNPVATTIGLTATPTLAKAGQVVTLTATVSGGSSPTGTVTFKDGATTLLAGVPLNLGSAGISANFTTAGIHSLTAVYSGDAENLSSTSAAVSLDVYTESVTYFHNDVAGTPLAATDAAGNLLWKESYRPYGDPMAVPLDANNKLWFAGKPYDKDSGLSYMGARYYDPLLGRFMGIDPVGFDEGNLHSFNRYAYANNNPNKFVDPDGRNAILVLAAFGLIANEVATSDVPMIGGGLAKTGATAAERLATNGVAGKTGEAVTRAELGAEKIAGEQITFITSTGQRTVADFVTRLGESLGIVETKTGNATLSAGQKQLKQDIENGVMVTPVGQRAKDAGLKPGQPTMLESHTTDRIKVQRPTEK